MEMNKGFLITKLAFLLTGLVTIIILTSCSTAKKSVSTNNVLESEVTEIGEGNTIFTFEIIDANNDITKYVVHTDEKTIGAALLKIGLIEGDESDFGLYVKVVNGIKADYNTNKAYWSLCIDGEYAMTGADSTDIEEDKIYAFVYTKE